MVDSVEALRALARPLLALLRLVVARVEGLGELVLLFLASVAWLFRPPFRLMNFVHALHFVGVGSLFIVLLTGTFTGAVLALQTQHAFHLFNAESMVGGTVALSLARELGPVLTALMVTARVGSAMATELGTMRVTEQIDALEALAVNPIQYLVTPRLLATMIMMPILTAGFVFVGMVGAFVVATVLLPGDPGFFMAKVVTWADANDLYNGMFKALVFGTIVATVSCYKGFHAGGGARGVGLATTQAVVTSSILVFVSDYFLTVAMY
jgi:phospholipid/cholesterol/gamma-HCH transport system permease protein